MSLIGRLLAFLNPAGRREGARGNRAEPRARGRHASARRCRNCNGIVQARTGRCPRCGTRMGPPAEAARRTHGLSHLERRILAGALDTADRRIQVFPTVGSAEGEIKVGTLRMQGHEALAAVDRLHDAGLIEWTDGAFAVTRDGRRAIERR